MLSFQYTEEANEFPQDVTDIDERSSFVIRKVCAKLDHSKITKPELVETIFRLVKGLIQDNEVIPIQSASTDISPADILSATIPTETNATTKDVSSSCKSGRKGKSSSATKGEEIKVKPV